MSHVYAMPKMTYCCGSAFVYVVNRFNQLKLNSGAANYIEQ